MAERKEYKLNLGGMSCGSCETLIKRVAAQNGADVSDIDAMTGNVVVLCEDEKLAELKQKFAEKGFPEKNADDGPRGDPKRVFGYLRSIIGGENRTEVETTLAAYSIGTASAILIVGVLLNLLMPAILQPVVRLAPLMVLLVFGTLMMLFSYHHVHCYRKNLSCANGMMVGMTIGMMGGFLAGAIIGATNGMFIGSLTGMFFGIVPGFVLGRYCGIMGAMEGIMAGIMAGTMGAMLSVMMVNDNLMAFLYILFGLCAIMIGSLSYMMHREAGPSMAKNLNTNFVDFATSAMAVIAIFTIIMVHAPKSGFVI